METDNDKWWTRPIFVLARDRKRRRVLCGGLGALGVGRMWFDEAECQRHEGFNTAPEMSESEGVIPPEV